MNRFSKYFKVKSILLACLLTIFGFSSNVAKAADSVNWTLPVIYGVGHFVRDTWDWFALETYRRTEGRLNIQTNQLGELGLKGSEALVTIAEGDYQMMEIGYGYASADEPLLSMYSVMGLNFSRAEAKKMSEFNADLIQQVFDKYNALALPLTIHFPSQGLFSKIPVRTIADLKGLKMRSWSKIQAEHLTVLGASPQVIPWAEAYTALQQGVVDAAITTPSAGLAVGFPEIVDYLSLLPQGDRSSLLVNKDAWNSLPSDVRTIVLEVAAEATEKVSAGWDKEESMVADLARGKGMTFIAPSAEWTESLVEALRPTWDAWAESAGPGGVEALQRIRTELNK